MSLIDDIKAWYEDECYPPSGEQLDYKLVNDEWVKQDTTTEEVSHKVVDSLRWGNVFVQVYRRDDEFVAVKDVEPATENQDWGDYGSPEIYHVRPVEVTVTKYERV